jgi:HK97 family phage major capsid protein
MPNPNDFDNQADFMKVCVPMRMKEGDTNEQAVGACMGIWRGKKSMDREEIIKAIGKREDVNPERGKAEYGDVTFADEKNKKYPIDTEEHIRAAWNYINKEGNAGKYSPAEVATIKRKIIAAWRSKIDKEGPPSAGKDEELIAFGSELKDLGGGKIGGYLVRFTTKHDPDLTGDYFDKDTELHVPDRLELLYAHGQDSTLKRRVLGKVTTKTDDAGLWAEAQMNLRDEYEKAIYNMAKEGKLGFSSGALSHLVEREPAGKAMHIKSWWIGEASLTPSPAEYRNSVMTLKSLIASDQAALTDADDRSKSNKGDIAMTEEEIKAATEKAVADALARREAEQKAEADKQAALKAAEETGYKKALDDVIKNRRPPAYNVIPDGTPDENNGGVPAFKHWIKTGQENSELIRPDAWDTKTVGYDPATKAAFNVTTGASGGFLVPDILYSQIIAKRQLASWVRLAPVQHFQTPADHLLVPVEDTKFSAFTQTSEAAAYTENEATVNQKDLVLYKYTKLVKMSEEFVVFNQTNFDAWLVGALARAEGITENTIFTTGTGGANPEGVSNDPTAGNTVTTTLTITPNDLTTLVGQLGAGYNTGAVECGFLMANATKYYIKGLSSSNYFAFIQTPNQGPSSGAQAAAIGVEGILGYPIYISDDMGAYASQTAKAVIFANFNFYGVVERPGMMVQRNPYLYMATGQIGLFASIYRGGGVLQKEAFYYLVPK